MAIPGYSGKPLAKKLGIKPGFMIRLINAPDHYFDLFTDMPDHVTVSADKKVKKNFIHYFAMKQKDIQRDIVSLRNEIQEDGMI